MLMVAREDIVHALVNRQSTIVRTTSFLQKPLEYTTAPKQHPISGSCLSMSSSEAVDKFTDKPMSVTENPKQELRMFSKRWMLVLIAVMYGTNYGVQRRLQ